MQAAPSLKIKGDNNRAAQSAPTNVTKGAIVTVDKMSAKDCKEGTVDADGKCLPNIQANTTSTTYQLGPFVFGSEPVKTSVGRQGKVEVEKDGSVEFEYGDGKGSRDAGINAPPPSAAEKQAGKKKQ
ncbi:MAG: hypothetical protein ACD_15C00103G0001 [uncultured bacterium]|nr:MAG: hypothetical protein ACD_15C00103G0001 [uncultured bacterium]